MKNSSDRIQTSHAGSLPRPDDLIEANAKREAGTVDEAVFQKKLTDSVADVVRRQVAAGITVPGDGEYGKSMGHKVNYRAWWSYSFSRLANLQVKGLGLSVGIVLECDLIVAEEGTQFQITETSRGLGAGKYWALMHYRGGGAFTMEAALTGRFFTAEEAHKANLINRVAPKGKYLEVARDLAGQVLKNPPLSVRSTVRMRRHYMDRLSREVMFMGAPERLYLSEDFQEAARAFAEKRKPAKFKGR